MTRHTHMTRDIKPITQCRACDEEHHHVLDDPDGHLDSMYLRLYNVTNQAAHLQKALASGEVAHHEEIVERDLAVMDAIKLAQETVVKGRLATQGEARLRRGLEQLLSELHDNPLAERIVQVLDGYKEE